MNKVALRGGFQDPSWNEFKKGCITEQLFNPSIAPDESIQNAPLLTKNNKKRVALPKLKRTILPRIDNKRPVNFIVKSKVLNVEANKVGMISVQNIKSKRNQNLNIQLPGLIRNNTTNISIKKQHNCIPNRTPKKADEKTNSNIYFWYFKDNQAQKSPRKKLKKLPKIKPEMKPEIKDVEVSMETQKTPEVKTETIKRNSVISILSRKGSILNENTIKEAIEEARRESVIEKKVYIEETEMNQINEDPLEIEDNKESRVSSQASEVDSLSPYMDHNAQRKPLLMKDMRNMPLSEKFYKDAVRMIYEPKTNTFIPKGVNTYLARMKKNNEREKMRELESRVQILE